MKEKEKAPGRKARREVISLSNEVIHESQKPFEDLGRRDLETKTAFDISCTAYNIEAKIRKVQRFRDKLMKRFAKLDDEGNVVVRRGEDGKIKWLALPSGQQIPDIEWIDKEGYDREIEKLARQKQDVKAYRVHIDDIGNTIKPETLKGLRWYLLRDDEEEEEEEEEEEYEFDDDGEAVDEDDEDGEVED